MRYIKGCSDAVSGVSPEVFGPVYHEPLASKEINSVRDAFCVNLILGALLEILSFLKAMGVLHTILEHFT